MIEATKRFISAAMGSRAPTVADFDVEDVLSKLDLSEKIALLSGVDFWHTAPVHRLGIPSIRLSDGPNGVRGTRFFNGVPAACLPCGTGLAATWDVDLVHEGGALQALEAVAKGASVILGPTTNMQRSPLGGRGFESFSEDPYLAGAMSAATVNGIQSKGVAATIKHFVCNDQEHERQMVDSIVTERALREIYLMPFQIAQRDSSPWCYMTAYNRINGTHVSESPKLIRDILRKEWGFDGLVMSDWFGTYSTTESIKAGLDLEMPGASYVRGKLVSQALGCGKLLPYDVDNCAREVLKLVKKVQPLGIPENAPEEPLDTPETAAALRSIAANSLVLLKNDNSILPFSKSRTTAVIGPNATFAAYSGGGSASLLPYYAVTPLEGIIAKFPKDHQPRYTLGCPGWKELPLVTRLTTSPATQKPGLSMHVYLEPPSDKSREQVDEMEVSNSFILLFDYKNPKLEACGSLYYVDLRGDFVPDQSATYEFSLAVAGTAKLYIDGELVVDNATKQKPGDSFFGSGTAEEIGNIELEKGKKYQILVQFATLPTMTFKTPGATGFGAGGLRIGGTLKPNAKADLAAAVKMAGEVDQVVLCAGLNSEWESEGYDRKNMDMPPGVDELISAVCKANPNTAVIIQSGTPVTMPWVDEANGLIQAWYGGNETGNAIADVVFGDINPGGKLPLTWPKRNEDNPAFLNYRSERGRTLYGEDIYVGYRFYEKVKRDVCFAFGHGLSYSTFDMKDLNVKDGEEDIVITTTVSNTGKVAGSEVVQVYVSQRKPSINRPAKELKGFKKVFLKAGVTEEVEIQLSKKYAASFWDEQRDSWIMEKDSFDVLVGNSSSSTSLKGTFVVNTASWWTGL